MKKAMALSIACISLLSANDMHKLETIQIQEKVNTKLVKDISSEEIKSADLAEALTKNIP